MKLLFDNVDLIYRVSAEHYELFGKSLKKEHLGTLNFQLFKDEPVCQLIKQRCYELFPDVINALKGCLNNERLGIAALDIPESDRFDKDENIVLGVALVTGIFENLGQANRDLTNHLPFQLHTASHTNEQILESRGLEKFTPAMKLGYHNDGLLSDTQVEIPHHIMVYNLHISYLKPGNFMWIPTACWDDAELFQKKARDNNLTVKIKVTPNYHLNDEGDVVNNMHHYVETPILRENEHQPALFFLNGQVRPEDNSPENVAFIQEMRDSLERNNFKICIPQQERRAFFIKNSLGFHARNIFEEPIDGVDLTRVYLRVVDMNAELYCALDVVAL